MLENWGRGKSVVRQVGNVDPIDHLPTTPSTSSTLLHSSHPSLFVHCGGGHDRTGMMVAVYRIVIQEWTKEQAIAEMKDFGFHRMWKPLENYIESLDVAEMKTMLDLNQDNAL